MNSLRAARGVVEDFFTVDPGTRVVGGVAADEVLEATDRKRAGGERDGAVIGESVCI